MKKIILLLCLFLVSSLTACSQNNNEENEGIKYKSSITELTNYKNIEYVVGDIEVDEKELNKLIDETIESWTHYEETERQVVKSGDMVNVTYFTSLKEGSVEGTSLTNNEDVDVIIGSKTMVDGFEDSLIGKTNGETIVVKLILPNDFEKESLRGSEIVFDITINSIKEPVKYKLDKESVSKNGYSSVDEFIESCRRILVEETYYEFNAERINSLVQYVVDNSKFRLNRKEVKTKTKENLDYCYELIDSYGVEKDQYFSKELNMTEREFKKECKNAAENDIKYELAAMAIIEAEGIDIEKFCEEEMEKYASSYGIDDLDFYIEMFGEKYIKMSMITDKAIEILIKYSIPVDKNGNKLNVIDMPVVAEIEGRTN